MKNLSSVGLTLTIAIAALAAAAFGQRPDRLSTEQWRVTEVNGVRITSSKPFVELNNNRNRFTGNAGCNQMFGGVSVIGRQIRFTNIGTTRMVCSGQANRIEQEIVNTLPRVTRYNQIGDRLEFYRRNQLVMRLTVITREFPNDRRADLGDRKWVLQQIGNQVNIRALPTALINFDTNKRSVGGDSSCNVFGGTYNATADRIRITDVVSTMRACIEDDRMSVERKFLDGLREANRYEIRDGLLRLYRDRRLLLTFRGERK
ncbi:MAG TPA: META domain-containing protein [Pyrinomonadaceae bacterium]|nr:META domain-containing protein [Pyrinomonadaceae bacterium]